MNAERVVLAGWTRAILLQVAHPLIAAGVVQHSTIRNRPLASLQRLHHTVSAMLGLTFGDAAAHARVIAEIRAIHRRVNGSLARPVGIFPAGARYSAEDPALVLWVHATLLESVLMAYDALVQPIDRARRDAYCREARAVPVELGAREAEVPRDWSSLESYLSEVYRSGAIAVGPDARTVSDLLLRSRFATLLGPVAWANRTLTVGWLPADIRAQYGFDWSDARARHFARTVATIRGVRRGLPDAVALWPESRRT